MEELRRYSRLLNRWVVFSEKLWEQFRAKGFVKGAADSYVFLAAFQELMDDVHYGAKDRAYHTAEHVEHCLIELEGVQNRFTQQLCKEPLIVELAIWFHDSIYDTARRDNEDKSAELAVNDIKLFLRNPGQDPMSDDFLNAVLGQMPSFRHICERVKEFILTTKHTAPLPQDKEGKSVDSDLAYFIDIDLAILGASAEKFDKYEAGIAKEYSWVERSLYAPTRAKILESFLERPRIYSTPHFFEKYEKQARENLARSIAALKAQ